MKQQLTTMRLAGAIVALAGLSLLAACLGKPKSTRAEDLGLEVASLQESLILADKAAADWHADAYLFSVNIPVGGPDQRAYQIGLDYASQEQHSGGLSIVEEIDDDYLRTQLFASGPVSALNSIGNEDWNLDSPDILQSALSDEGVEEFVSHLKEGDVCGLLVLRRKPGLSDRPVVWRASVYSCQRITNSVSVFVDPISGEIIK